MAWFREETRQIRALSVAPNKLSPPSRLVLRGRIVTMDEAFNVIPDGLLAIEDKHIVHCAPSDQPLPGDFAAHKPIDVNGTIYPGLFELHNHPSYNAIPLWAVPAAYQRRKQWQDAAKYERFVKNPATLLTHDPLSNNARAVIRFVESRALLGGVTTTQGLSILKMDNNEKAAYAGLVRNVELPDDKSWPIAEDRIGDFTSFDQANKKYGPILGDKTKPFLLHLSEGTDDISRGFFEALKRPDGSYLIGANLIGIHATALNPEQMGRMKESGGIVWSPLSNFLLYGATTDVASAVKSGVPIALGSDWGPSGTKNLLGELKIARIVSAQLGSLFSDLDLARMVTSTPARMMGWGEFLGSLEVGKIADLLVLDGTSKDPYAQLVEAWESEIIAVLIDGRPRIGRASVIDPTTKGVEMLRVGQQDMVLDIIDRGHPLDGMALGTAISTLSYALEHLPDLAEQFLPQHQLMREAADRFYVQLDMDEDYAMELMIGAKAIGRTDVEPMVLDPITEIDDDQFRVRIKQNINIPQWLRSAL
ncbi:amidohydrolase family protein [Microvirga tunisiensis]|uniref:Amidohydrolase family protein n=1 Tax=Microvirga tunisiensis TaxID=2108360 RepID=A0A5N7MJD1_9HYPH|nr:amidohydrolase family protein [Microvirga tunisiensis]MPR08864.1 amidohydrolase family protein [Microvirga tunisiensis]MPR27047.1 amidohydrolase family protein [Microvirga tunisiensis]